MKCPECVKEEQRSYVYGHGGSMTLLYCPPFYNEDGVYHHHDHNYVTANYACSRGHTWSESVPQPCPAAGCDFQ